MKTYYKLSFCILIFFFCLSFNLFAKIKVVTTLPDFAAITESIGKDQVEVKSIAKGDQDPHFLEPKPSYIVLASQADLLIEAGLELEVGWLPVLLTQSRNSKIQSGQRGHLNLSEGLEILEIPSEKVDRSMGDIHPLGNPHYWLNPHNGLKIAQKIAQRLSELDPGQSAFYQKNLETFQNSLKTKISQWEQQLNKVRGAKIVTQHKSFSYFVKWANIEVIGYVEPKPGIPPSAGDLLSLIQKMQSEKARLLITENYYDPKSSKTVAEKTNIKSLSMPTSVGGEESIKTYEDLFDTLVSRLVQNL